MTIIKDTTFANYKWQPQLGYYRMSVFYVRRRAEVGGIDWREGAGW